MENSNKPMNPYAALDLETARTSHALLEAQEHCSNERQRMGLNARAARAGIDAWLQAVMRDARRAWNLAEQIEAWADGGAFPPEAEELVRQLRAGETAVSTATPLAGAACEIALAAYVLEHPEMANVIRDELGYESQGAERWALLLASSAAAQAENGESIIPELQRTMQSAIEAAVATPPRTGNEPAAAEVEAAE